MNRGWVLLVVALLMAILLTVVASLNWGPAQLVTGVALGLLLAAWLGKLGVYCFEWSRHPRVQTG